MRQPFDNTHEMRTLATGTQTDRIKRADPHAFVTRSVFPPLFASNCIPAVHSFGRLAFGNLTSNGQRRLVQSVSNEMEDGKLQHPATRNSGKYYMPSPTPRRHWLFAVQPRRIIETTSGISHQIAEVERVPSQQSTCASNASWSNREYCGYYTRPCYAFTNH